MNSAPFRWISLFILAAVAVVAALPLVGKAADDDVTAWQGKPAPEIALTTLDGKDFKLSEQKGKVVVVDIWATWCPPCRKSLPHLNSLSENKEFAAKGLVVTASNSGEKKPVVEKFVTDNKYTFTVLLDETSSVGKMLKVRGIPTTLIIGRDGVVKNVFVGFGPDSEKTLDEAVEKALAEPAPGKPA